MVGTLTDVELDPVFENCRETQFYIQLSDTLGFEQAQYLLSLTLGLNIQYIIIL